MPKTKLIFYHGIGVKIIVVFILLAQNTMAQKLFPFSVNGKFGYCDSQKRIKIPPQFDSAFWFNEQFAIIKNNNKFGLIDSIGNIILPATWQRIENFQNYCFQEKGQDGYCIWPDSGYKFKIFMSDTKKTFDFGQVLIKQNINGKFILQKNNAYISKPPYHNDSRVAWIYANKKFKKVQLTKKEAQHSCVGIDIERFMPFEYKPKNEEPIQIFFNNKTGFTSNPNSLAMFGDTLLTYSVKKWSDSTIKIKTKKVFKVNIPVIYDGIWKYTQNIYLVKLNKKFGIVSNKNEILAPIEYDEIDDIDIMFDYGLPLFRNDTVDIFVCKKKSMVYPKINTDTSYLIKTKYKDIRRLGSDDDITTLNNNLEGKIDLYGNIILEPIYKDVYAINNHQHYIAQDTNNYCNIYNVAQKKWLLDTNKFISIKAYTNNIFNKTAKVYCVLKDNNNFQIYNLSSNTFTKIEADSIVGIRLDYEDSSKIIFKYLKNKKWGLITINTINDTIKIMPTKYTELNFFDNDLCIDKLGLISAKMIEKNIEFGYIDCEQNEYFP